MESRETFGLTDPGTGAGVPELEAPTDPGTGAGVLELEELAVSGPRTVTG